MNFKETLQGKTREIEEIIKAYLPREEGLQRTVLEAMNYSVLAGGKRLRPMLMQETYGMFGGEGQLIHPFMAAIELIHTYSLVHDDLPAMDNDEFRRGKKTTWAVYGEDMGILAGDALLNYAFETAAQAFSLPGAENYAGRALQILTKKAGIYGMIGGQVVDVQAAGKPLEQERLEFIYALKTGALIESSMMIGAVLAGAEEPLVKQVEQAARDVGLAFQIQDDILDVTSSLEVLGKPIHSDDKNEKTTYVTIKGLEQAKADVEQISRRAMETLKSLPCGNPFLLELIEMLITRES